MEEVGHPKLCTIEVKQSIRQVRTYSQAQPNQQAMYFQSKAESTSNPTEKRTYITKTRSLQAQTTAAPP
jgi:hypothetical protein